MLPRLRRASSHRSLVYTIQASSFMCRWLTAYDTLFVMRRANSLRIVLGGMLGIAGLGDALGSWPQYVGEQRSDPAGKVYRLDSSTAFFNWVMAAGLMNVSADFFCGFDAAPVTPHGAPLTADRNAWCVTVGIHRATPDGVPILFTKNLNVGNLSDFRGRIRDTLVHSPPFDDKGGIVLLNGGRTLILRGNLLDQTWENVLGVRRMSGEVLRP